jgi:hypothetical protein
MKKIAVKIKNANHGIAVQRELFRLGYRWSANDSAIKNRVDRWIFSDHNEHEHLWHNPCPSSLRRLGDCEITLDDLFELEPEDMLKKKKVVREQFVINGLNAECKDKFESYPEAVVHIKNNLPLGTWFIDKQYVVKEVLDA